MAALKVEYGEEGLRLVPAVAPVRLAAGVVPGARGSLELVVLLRVICAVITRRTQSNWEGLDVLRQSGRATHVVRTECGLIDPGDDAASAGSAHTGRGKGPSVANSLGGELVDVGRDRVRVAVAADVSADVLAREP